MDIIKGINNKIKENIVAALILAVSLAVILLVVGFFIGKESVFGFMLSKIGELILVAVIVKIVLSLNTFSQLFTDTLKDFFTSSEYLSRLNISKLHSLVVDINKLSGGSYKVVDDEKLSQSIKLAKKHATEKGYAFFSHSSEISKIFYAKHNLEISYIRSDIEMLKNKKLEFNYNFKTDNKNRALPPFSDYEKNQDRFNEYTFQAYVITENGNSTIKNHELKIIVNEDEDTHKSLTITSSSVLNKGDRFILEICASNKEETVETSTPPKINITKPAGVRKFNILSECFKDVKSSINSGNLYYGEKDKATTIDTDSKQEENQIFYHKTSWSLYYEDLKDFKEPEVILEVY